MFTMEILDIYDAIRPLHLCSKFIGLTSFTIKRDRGIFKGSISAFDISCIILSTFLCCASAFNVATDIKNFINLPEIYTSVFVFNVITMLFYGNLAMNFATNTWLLASREKFAKILNVFTEIDQILATINIKFNYGKHKKVIIFYISTCAIFQFCEIFSVYYLCQINHWENQICFAPVLSIYIILTFLLLSSHFTLFVWAIQLRYQAINKFLCENFSTSHAKKYPININQCQMSYQIAKSHNNLAQISLAHDKLVDLAELISFCYGVSVSLKYN